MADTRVRVSLNLISLLLQYGTTLRVENGHNPFPPVTLRKSLLLYSLCEWIEIIKYETELLSNHISPAGIAYVTLLYYEK